MNANGHAARRSASDAPGFFLLVFAVILAVAPMELSAQDGFTAAVGPVLARRADREGGPSLGRVGVEAQVFRVGESRQAWGIALGYHPLGRFPNPVPGDYFDEHVFALGPRIRWDLGASGGPFASLGPDLLLVANDNPFSGTGHDPAIAVFAGFGHHLGARSSRPRMFLEGGLHGLAATGELTSGSGFYGTLMLGVAF